ncbi:mucin-3B-like isoform X2 [Danaus plexippus]|uniref:mucin-3B-like isoform X2 n=1 Tax=Danaus plexippus TaxID=13037 RepID=UPI002AB0B47B|nr:mucin-3B-like isoform X2 [Danaus plexippus]
MEFCIIGFKNFLIFVLILMLPCAACSNIDCNGKAFHCVNSTHFKICVDFGGGISTTVDEYLIPCPQDTVCKSYNLYECEYEKTTTSSTVTVQSEVTNELFESIGVSSGEYSDVTTVFPTNQEPGRKLSKNYENTDSTSARPISTLPSHYVLNKVTVANLSTLNSSNTLQSSRELLNPEKNIVLPKNIKILPPNIIQSVTENYNDTSNSTETPLSYSTLLDRVSNDNLINKNSTSLPQQPATSSVSPDLNDSLNQDLNNLKSTDLNTVSKFLLQNSNQDTTHILDDNNLPNRVTVPNDLDSATTYNYSRYNKSDFITNSYHLEFSTIGPPLISRSVNVSSELNSLFITTTETYDTAETKLQINLNKAKDKQALQKIKDKTFPPRPIEDTNDQFPSTIYSSNTEVDIEKGKYIYPNLENNELFKFNDSHIIISTPSLPTTSGNVNNITSQRIIVLDNGVDSNTKIDLFLDKQNFTHIDIEQTPDKDTLNLKKSLNSLAPLAFLNDTKHTTSAQTHFPDDKVMSPTEGVTLSTEANNESRTLVLKDWEDFYKTKRLGGALTSSLFPNTTTVTTETISYQTTKDEISITTLDYLAKETTPKFESSSEPTLILNTTTTTFDKADLFATIEVKKAAPETKLDVTNEIRPIILGDPNVLLQENTSKSLSNLTTESVPYKKIELGNHTSTKIHTTPAATTVDVTNEIRSVVLSDSDLLFKENTSKSLINVTTESIPYNKMKVENRTSTEIHTTPASTTVDVINEIRPVVLSDSDVLFKENTSKSLSNLSTESIPYNKMKVENRTSTEIHTTPAATTVDVINEIRPVVLSDSDLLFKENTSKSLINVTTESIPYNKMKVENRTSTEIHTTPAATTVDVTNEIRSVVLSDSDVLFKENTSKSLSNLSTESIPYNKMKVENRTSTEIHTTPASTTVDVINEIRPVVLSDSDVLFKENTSKSLINVTTESIPYNKMKVENRTSTEIHTTPASTTVDVINEIRPVVLSDSDVLFKENTSKSLSNLTTESIPYNKMKVENRTSTEIHTTPASTTVDVTNEIRSVVLSDSDVLFKENTSKSLSNLSTESIPYNKMKVENRTSTEIHTTPAATTVDVTNEIRSVVLSDSDVLFKENTSKSLSNLSTESIPYNKMKVENRTSTEIHTTPAATTVDVINEIRPIILGGSDVLLPGNISIELIKQMQQQMQTNLILI